MLRAQPAAKGGSQPARSDAVRGETLRNEAPVRAIGPSSEAATQRPGRGGRRAGASAAPSGAPQAVDDETARTEGAEPVAGAAPTRRRTARTRAAGAGDVAVRSADSAETPASTDGATTTGATSKRAPRARAAATTSRSTGTARRGSRSAAREGDASSGTTPAGSSDASSNGAEAAPKRRATRRTKSESS